MPSTEKFRQEIKAGYWGPGAFAGYRSCSGNLVDDLQAGDRVRAVSNHSGVGRLGKAIHFREKHVLVRFTDGDEAWVHRSFVVYEPTENTLAKRSRAIRSEWDERERRLRSGWAHTPDVELPQYGGLFLVPVESV